MTELEKKRYEMIAEHRKQIPTVHRANYDRAVSGRSRKAAMKAFCLECVCWQKEEVRLCTSLACPLYPYRVYKNRANRHSEQRSLGVESTKTGTGGNHAG